MDFIRRLFNKSADSGAEAPDHKVDVVITHGDDTQPTKPPEAVVEMPESVPPASEERFAESGTVSSPDTKPSETDREDAESLVAVADLAAMGTRPLPPLETIVPQPGQRLVFGLLSDVGMVRGNNQDAVYAMVSSATTNDDPPDFGLFIVADGMGGHQEGERASAITVRTVTRYVLDEIYAPLIEQRMNDPERPSIADMLRAAVQAANEAVTSEIPEGGTTATIAIILGDLVYIAHVGDSRAYLLNGEGIEQVTRDHSLVQRLIELDQLTPEEAVTHPQRNVLYKAIGQSETLEVDTITRRMQPRACVLLCSDGLWNLIPEDTIQEVVRKSPHPQDACNTLVKMANERGGPDNITVVLVQAPG
jgi:PPM family protein phosphatase